MTVAKAARLENLLAKLFFSFTTSFVAIATGKMFEMVAIVNLVKLEQ